jgi:glycosyltransferase involved in cell wall biosynthesis
MAKKVIWFINQYAGSKHHGMNFRGYYLGLSLIEKGHEVYVFGASFTHLLVKPPKTTGIFTHEKVDGINYIWVKVPRYGSSTGAMRALSLLIFLFRLSFFKTDSISKPDAIIVSSPAPTPTILGYLWAKKYGAKFFFEIRDLWALTMKNVGKFSSINPYVLLMELSEWIGFAKTDKVVSLLPEAWKYTTKRGMKLENFVYIPNGVFLPNSNGKSQTHLDESISSKIPSNKFIVGYAGTVGFSNNLDLFIDAADLLKENANVHFVLVGRGMELENLQKKAENLPNVTFLGHQPSSTIPSILKKFDVCYIGLKKEKLYKYGVSPNKLFEYLLAAKPIICAIDSSNRIVEEANAGFVIEPNNATEIADAVLKIFNMTEDERIRLGENGRKYVLEKHTYEKITEKYLEII